MYVPALEGRACLLDIVRNVTMLVGSIGIGWSPQPFRPGSSDDRFDSGPFRWPATDVEVLLDKELRGLTFAGEEPKSVIDDKRL
jgi:hypothetical protein